MTATKLNVSGNLEQAVQLPDGTIAGQIFVGNDSTNPVPVSNAGFVPSYAVSVTTASFAAAANVTGAIDLGSQIPIRLLIPSTGWTSANLTFQVSQDGTTYYNLYDETGTEKTVTVGALTANRAVYLSPSDFAGMRYLIIRSGTSAAPVAQTNATSITVVTRY